MKKKSLLISALTLSFLTLLFIYGCQNDDENLPNIFEPSITAINPKDGPIGTEVEIIGSKFSIVPDQNLVRFGEANATIIDANPDTIWVRVPPGASTGPISLRIKNDPDLDSTNIAQSIDEFNVLSPNITEYEPASGIEGDEIAIKGQYIPASDNQLQVLVNGTAVQQILSKTDSLVKIVLPPDISTGPIAINAFGEAFEGPEFIVLPQILGVIPASAPPGTEVVINGKNFGEDASSIAVKIGALEGELISANDTLLKVLIPELSEEGKTNIVVSVEDNNSALFPYTITPSNAPIIFEIVPTCGLPGDPISIKGLNFDTDPGNTSLLFKGISEDIALDNMVISATEITGNIPAGAVTGAISLKISALTAVGPAFTLTPTITNFAPKRTWSGNVITITGLNFADPQANEVKLSFPLRNGGGFAETTPLEVNGSFDEMKVKVPSESGTGPIKLTINGKEITSTNDLTTINPKIDDVKPNWAPVGDLITLEGGNFSPNANQDSVIFTLTDGSRVKVAAESSTNTSLTVRVPAGAGEDFIRIKVLDSEIRKGPWFRTGSAPKSLFTFRGSGINGQGRGLIHMAFKALQPKDGNIGVTEDIIIPFSNDLGQIKILDIDPDEEKIYMLRNNAVLTSNYDGSNLEVIFDDNNTPGIKFRALTGMKLDVQNQVIYLTTNGNDKNVDDKGILLKGDLSTQTMEILYDINDGFFATSAFPVVALETDGQSVIWGQKSVNTTGLPIESDNIYNIMKGDINGGAFNSVYSAQNIFDSGEFQNVIDANNEATQAIVRVHAMSEIVIHPTSAQLFTATIFPSNQANSGVFGVSRIYEGSINGSNPLAIRTEGSIFAGTFGPRSISNFKYDENSDQIYGILRAAVGGEFDRIFRLNTTDFDLEILYLTPSFKLVNTIVIDPRK